MAIEIACKLTAKLYLQSSIYISIIWFMIMIN
jgi:hypothetical protein